MEIRNRGCLGEFANLSMTHRQFGRGWVQYNYHYAENYFIMIFIEVACIRLSGKI